MFEAEEGVCEFLAGEVGVLLGREEEGREGGFAFLFFWGGRWVGGNERVEWVYYSTCSGWLSGMGRWVGGWVGGKDLPACPRSHSHTRPQSKSAPRPAPGY